MYVRIAEVTSTSDMQFKMLMAFIENVLLPRNIQAGQLSGEIFKTATNSCFVVSRFPSGMCRQIIQATAPSEAPGLSDEENVEVLLFFYLPLNGEAVAFH